MATQWKRPRGLQGIVDHHQLQAALHVLLADSDWYAALVLLELHGLDLYDVVDVRFVQEDGQEIVEVCVDLNP